MEHITDTPTLRAPAERFTGDVYLNMIETPAEPARLAAALVRFTPGARTNWHSHALGQVLHITDGVGLVGTRDGHVIRVSAGETVKCPRTRNTGTAPPTPTSWPTSPWSSAPPPATARPGWSR